MSEFFQKQGARLLCLALVVGTRLLDVLDAISKWLSNVLKKIKEKHSDA